MPTGAPGAPAAAMQETLEGAGRIIDRLLQEDRSYPDLSDLLNVPVYNCPTVSGISDMDYPLQGPGLVTVPTLPELSTIRRVPLPPELVDQFAHMQCYCMMGVFPEINRAWLTIDNDIFMWNYEDGGDVAYFDGLSETILSVGLVRPKDGIFQPHIRYLLVVATPVDIVILGLSFANLQAGNLNDSMSVGMQLLPDPLYSIPTDNTYLLSITSTDNGRIFLAGKDGCLYEVAYQAEAGWFSQRCRKINHSKSTLSFLVPTVLQFSFSEDDPIVQIAVDNSRNILYTRSEKGVLQVYDLGYDGNYMSRVASLSLNGIVSAAGNIARTIDRSVFKPIVQIAVIEKSESVNCHLLAITHAGVRLYFTTSPFKQPNARPSMLAMIHVRLPPGFSASSNVEKPLKVHKALYKSGILLMAASENEDHDILWCVNHDSFPFQKPLTEIQVTVHIDGHTWSLSCIDEDKAEKIVTPLNKDIIPVTDLPVMIQQHVVPPKKFVLLSAKGSHIFHKLRPVDQLRHLLVANGGGDGEEIERFFKLHQEDQACATCLILACSSSASDREVSAWATRAFFRYGGEAQMRIQSSLPAPTNVGALFGSPVAVGSPINIGSPVPNPSFLGTPMQGVYPSAISTPVYAVGSPVQQSTGPLAGILGPEVIFSGKHNGICIYFARIVNNIWDGSVAVERIYKMGNRDVIAIDSSVPPQVLESVLQELKGLLEFLDRNSQFAVGSLGNPSFGTPVNIQQRLLGHGRDMGGSHQAQQELQRKYHSEAQLAEKLALQGIHQLVRKTCQALALWKLLCEHQISHIAAELQKELQEQLKITTFKELVIRDKELIGALVASLINCYIRDNAAVDGISTHLQEVCPLLYSPDDAICSKANELLQRSRQAQNKFDKERMLRESLREYQKISQQVDLANVCAQYRQVRFYEGVVELCLTAAEKKDPQGLGLHFHKNGEPEEDAAGLQAFQDRLNSYKCITDTLQELVNQSKAAPQSPSVPKKPGPPVLSSDPNMLSNEEAGLHFEQMLKLAQHSTDELFSIALFNWLVQADLTDKLLELNSPYLEPHLVRMAKLDQNKVRYMDLQWRYYEKHRNFSSAARVVAKLATMPSTDISLKQRIEYLSIAILSAKSSAGNSALPADGEFLHELEEQMEVARIQLHIQDMLIRRYSHHPSAQDAIVQLDTELMDVTKLFAEFAETFKLSESKLAILHCAGHSDPILVQNLWQEIIERELIDSRGINAVDRMQALNLKLTALGKIYASNPRYFPLEFLVQYLEQQVCNLGWDVGYVTKTMEEIDVSVVRLLEVYDHLFKARDPFWNRVKKPLHLLDSIHILLSGYVQDPNRVPSYERRRFNTVCLDAIACYLVELQSMEPTPAVQTRIGNLKSLQAKLERLGP
ncbi:nuclear pore complex protein Nup155 [Hyperolius riggenbachi]|uniref:nuclear pore complex protein Nup155 n=1 Tax=Hyperolius riggenbachi TaxID=752182 RepID=UPI0035A38299